MNDEPTEILEGGTQIWKNSEGQYHRDHDLPAVVWPSGTSYWYQNGLLHRDNDLPAIVWPDGRCEWCINGLRHRDNDLPAVIWPDDWCYWYQNDRYIREAQRTKEETEQYKKPYYLQKPKKKIKFDRFKKLIK